MRYEYVDVYEELKIVFYGTIVDDGTITSIHKDDYKEMSVLVNIIGSSPMLF